MSVTRRGFLKGMAGILAASQAPAILARSSVMDIYVPKKEVVIAQTIPDGRVKSLVDHLDAEARRLTGPHDDAADALSYSVFEVAGLRKNTLVSIIDTETKQIYFNQSSKDKSRVKVNLGVLNRPVEVHLSAAGYREESHLTSLTGDWQKLVVNQTRKDADTYQPKLIEAGTPVWVGEDFKF